MRTESYTDAQVHYVLALDLQKELRKKAISEKPSSILRKRFIWDTFLLNMSSVISI